MADRVLLVEDDPSVARFVSMALEHLPIELVVCSTVAKALAALHSKPVCLVISDLMLPGESGLSLLQTLHDQPLLRQGALMVAFSAGVNTEVRRQLDALQVWRVLSKPTSLEALETCVRDALGYTAQAGASPATVRDAVTDAERAAIESHFAGDTALFMAYRSSCRQQFLHDASTGDAALLAKDAAAIRRLAHSLATVLLTLGLPDASREARELEHVAEQGDWDSIPKAWARLRPHVATVPQS